MKKDWTYKQFEDCIEKVKYTTKIQSKDYLDFGNFPIISQEDELISGYWNDPKDVFYMIRPLVIFGDHTRVLKYIDFDFVLGADGVKILLPFEDLEAKFLYHFLKWYNVPNLGYSRHYKLLKEISIPIPPLSIQRSIVSELDLLHLLIEKKQEQLRALDNLAQSLFYQMFGDPITNPMGWEIKKLGEVAEAITGITYKPADVAESGTIVLRSGNIQNGEIDLNDIVRVQRPISDKYFVQEGDILMCSRNGSFRLVGKAAKIPAMSEKMTWGAFMTIIRSEINPYILAFLRTPAFRVQLTSAKTTTVNQITIGMFSKIPLPLPPLSLQQLFAAKVSAIEAQKRFISQSIKEVESLLAQRMDHYFG